MCTADPRIQQLEIGGFKFNVVSCCWLKKEEWGLISIRAEDVATKSCQELAELIREGGSHGKKA